MDVYEKAKRSAEGAVRHLRETGMTVAFAESITGGLCAKLVTDIPGASAVLRGSAVVYATDTKTAVLGVSREVIDRYGVVSEECACEMARGAAAVFASDVALSLTGLADASPYSDGNEVEPGTVCIGICFGDTSSAFTVKFPPDLSRDEIRHLTASAALEMLTE